MRSEAGGPRYSTRTTLTSSQLEHPKFHKCPLWQDGAGKLPGVHSLEGRPVRRSPSRLSKSIKMHRPSDFQNLRISEIEMHEQRDLVELRMIHYTPRKFLGIVKKTDRERKSGRRCLKLRWQGGQIAGCNPRTSRIV